MDTQFRAVHASRSDQFCAYILYSYCSVQCIIIVCICNFFNKLISKITFLLLLEFDKQRIQISIESLFYISEINAFQLNDLWLFPSPDPLLLVDDDSDHLLGVQAERFSLSCVFTSTKRLNMAPGGMKTDEEIGITDR